MNEGAVSVVVQGSVMAEVQFIVQNLQEGGAEGARGVGLAEETAGRIKNLGRDKNKEEEKEEELHRVWGPGCNLASHPVSASDPDADSDRGQMGASRGGGCDARQRWHFLTGAKRKTSQVGCKRSPHQKSVMYAKLCHYEGRTNGWGWCNCLKQGISLSLMSWASVMGLFTLLS